MKPTFRQKAILLVLVLLVMIGQVSNPVVVWDERLVPVGRVRQARNFKRNQARWAKRWRRWQRQQPRARRASRRRRRLDLVQYLLRPSQAGPGGTGRSPIQPREPEARREPPVHPPDPLADLRQQRGWIDRMSERELWALLGRVRWPHGAVCIMDPEF
jgi:hypothetical protein